MNKYKIVVCDDIDSLRYEMDKTARIFKSIGQNLILDRNDCTVKYRIILDTWYTIFILPSQIQRVIGANVDEFYTVGPESDAMFELTELLSHRYFIAQNKEQLCRAEKKLVSSRAEIMSWSSLKRLASRIIKWIRF